MIRRVRLRNWQSYEDIELELGPGTTFVVAPNGVGKTSLVLGLAWATFGDCSNIDPKECIRAGTAAAEVEVDLDLPNGSRLAITRSVRRRRGPRMIYRIDGALCSERAAEAQMEQVLGAELSVAGRLATMVGGGHIAAENELNLEAHLHHAFGVSHLLETANLAAAVRKEAEKARAALRTDNKARRADRAAIESDIAELESEMERLEARTAALEARRDRAETDRSFLQQQQAVAEQWERYETTRQELFAGAGELFGRTFEAGDDDALRSALGDALQQVEQHLAAVTDQLVAARSVVGAIDEAVGLLEVEYAVCPTCLRHISAGERDSAKHLQLERRTNAETEVRRLESLRETAQANVDNFSRLSSRLESLAVPPDAASRDALPDPALVEALVQEAGDALAAHHREIGATRGRIESLRADLDAADRVQQDNEDMRLAYRREAAARAGAQVLRSAANAIIESRIEPLTDELVWRWRLLFPRQGLSLRPDGSIVRREGDREITWDSLSGGERTWARIVTHLLVLVTTTRLPFAWFDEPLEHLDPQFRRAVAAALATTTETGSLRQLLVTTYEHSLAQQLADTAKTARIITIRQSHG